MTTQKVRTLVEAFVSAFLFFATESLGRAGLTSVAEPLCKLGSKWDPGTFHTELAWVRCYAGDLEGGMRLLSDTLPGEERAFHRALLSGLMCEYHKQNDRAADFYEQMLSMPDPQSSTGKPINPEFRPHMRDHVVKLRSLAERAG